MHRGERAVTSTDATTHELLGHGLMTVAEAAEFLSLGRTTLYGLMDAGRLPYVKIGRARRIPRAALVRLAAENLKGHLG
jgi:excisionase family DNA binding protein